MWRIAIKFNKKALFIFFCASLYSNISASAELNFEQCLKVLGAGFYNQYLETYCSFDGGVGNKLNYIYTEGGCRSTVPQEVVDSMSKQVINDSTTRMNSLGKDNFCAGNKKAYYDLAKNSLDKSSKGKDKLPHFNKHESYASIRTKMLKAGWQPFHSKDADTCMEGDSRCQGRPEMESCAGTGLADCRFLWKKDGKTIRICTIGEDNPVYNRICN